MVVVWFRLLMEAGYSLVLLSSVSGAAWCTKRVKRLKWNKRLNDAECVEFGSLAMGFKGSRKACSQGRPECRGQRCCWSAWQGLSAWACGGGYHAGDLASGFAIVGDFGQAKVHVQTRDCASLQDRGSRGGSQSENLQNG
jgi:hypothetical protein